MQKHRRVLSRRQLIASLAAAATLPPALGAPPRAAETGRALPKRPVPSTGVLIPPIGMGTWITFNVGDDPSLRAQRTEVLRTFFQMGGGMIDSSPMYGSSEEVVGHCLSRIDDPSALFSATKVWTWLGLSGPGQIDESRELWGLEIFDLVQVHNLLSWESHLETLLEQKAQGRIRHVGMTTSHGRRHEEMEAIMASQPIDCVQFTYNILDREAEQRLLPLAAERGLAVIANRPFRQGELFRRFGRHPLPGWAAEIGCANWAQFLLKFIISHPAVTCAIPATSRIDHMQENMGALEEPLPDQQTRQSMIDYVEAL